MAVWAFTLLEINLVNVLLGAVKGQAIADFIIKYLCIQDERNGEAHVQVVPWTLYFDGSCVAESTRARILIVSLQGQKFTLMFRLHFDCSNNQIEYKGLIVGLNILIGMKARFVKIIGDS
ncbi:hypothetical protein BT93_L5090 [Corymbia citriodora subsp. variegata]|uniref:RNase H type-1 domain-containing protein n=1 Tax=Corymbia citriodora subsp. variegata TaxID=360336 RepID=A0A8T0CWH5_CORYI|nr:hypothetical protein BT93_L5090 [Corymbia citriodora subsp. variegata]